MTKHIVDGALVLRAASEAAETASANEAGVAMEGLVPSHYANKVGPDAGFENIFKAVFHNIALGGDVVATGIAFVIDTDSLAAFSDSPVEVGRATMPSTASPPDVMEIVINMAEVYRLDPNAAAIRCGVEVTGGTNPTVDYGCFLTKA